MNRPLQINTLFRGFAWALSLLILGSCDPWKLKSKKFLPTVVTMTPVVPTGGTSKIVTGGIELRFDGDAPVTSYGICYSATNQAPTIQDGTMPGSKILVEGQSDNSIQFSGAAFEEGTTYYYRAYATNSVGTNYGEKKQFTVPVVTGLVAYYRFTNSGLDETSNKNDGVNSAGWGLDRKNGSANGSLSLNGTAGYFEAPDSQSLREINQLTVSFWFKATALPTNDKSMQFFYKGRWDNLGGEQYSAKISRLQGGTLQITGDAKKDGNCLNGEGWRTPYDTSPSIIPGVEWYHMVVVFDGIQGKVYINGREGTGAAPLLVGIDKCQGGPLRIGAQVAPDPRYFNGQIDDFRIYSRALNLTQINALFKEQP
jgi:hypothetical protein